MKRLGLDIGSGSISAVLLDERFEKLKSLRKGISGDVIPQTIRTLDELCRDSEYEVGITGMNGKQVSEMTGIPFVLDAVSVLEGMELLHPDARTVFDIGKEKSSAYIVSNEGSKLNLVDFSTNSFCSAGGGALIEKMSSRLEFSTLDDFVCAAMNAKNTAKISARCSVFAESDVVHHFQRGAVVNDIAAGLCQVLARNFVNNICKGKDIEKPIYLLGGVAMNKAVVNFLIQEVGKKIIVPEDFLEVKAIGAAYAATSKNKIQEVKQSLLSYKHEIPSSRPPLRLHSDYSSELPYEVIERSNGNEILLSINKNYRFSGSGKTKAFLGLDVGSVSTKQVLLDGNKVFILGLYERTRGKPIDAVKDVIGRTGNLELYGRKIKDLVDVVESGTTGSGRVVAAKIIDAGVVKNEITAQAAGASYYYPDVRTVFEIGGQDSKYISLDNGVVVDCEMNKVCAASTGSFLEEQARVLDINIEKDFEGYALTSESPCRLPERCAVLMASSLLFYQKSPLEDKCAGLAYAIILNYLNRVAKKDQVGDIIVFQGAVAFNKAVVAGFETLLGKRVYVPEYPHLTGAIGVARISKQEYEKRRHR